MLTTLEVSAGVAILTLNDPNRRNVMSPQLVAEVIDIVSEVEANEAIGALIVTGAPPAFCAGADLGSLADQHAVTTADAEASLRAIYEGFLRVARCSLPTIAAVNGAAVGAGMNLALACDLTIAGESARFDTRFLDIGLHPGGGHTFMLNRRVGAQVAAAMVMFGDRFDGATAAERGLAYKCVPDVELLSASMSLAERAAGFPRELAVRVKETMRAAAAIDHHAAAVDAELEAQVWSLQQSFFKERLAAARLRMAGKPAQPQP
ncbi:MAG: enoyl-CoA hydratase [Acidimicrobiales bacterium]